MRKRLWLASTIGVLSAVPAYAGFEFDLGEQGKITVGGYFKVDARYVDGDVAYQDYWRGNNPGAEDTSHFGMNVRETRFNALYQRGAVSAFVEMDFYGGGGNEIATNSSNPRLRHAYITYENWMVGQNWTTFMSLAALPDSIDFAGPIVGEVFIRQPQIRYTLGNLKLAIENPETWGDGDTGSPSSGAGLSGTEADEDESNPDLIGSYTFKGGWGEVSIAGLVRWVDQGGIDDVATALNVGGMVKVFDKDDIRFQVTAGESGRYVGAALTNDVVTDPDTGDAEVEETVAYTVAYRHLWSDNWRSSVYYGAGETDVLGIERSHWGVNLIRQLTPDLWAGVEVGQFAVDDDGTDAIDSDYLQFSMKFTL